MSGTFENAIRFSALLFDSAVCTSSPAKRPPPPTGISSLRPIMSMFRTAAIVVQRRERLLGVRPGAEQAALLGVPRREQHAALRPLPLLRGERVGFGDLDQRHDARAVVVRAVEDLRRVGAVVVVVRRHDHPFVLQPRVAPFEQRDDVAVGDDVAVDRGAEIDAASPAAPAP